MRTPPPFEAATDLVAAFEDAGRQARPVSRTCTQVSAAIGPPCDADDEALHRASLMIARAIDDDDAHFDRHPYHNRRHFCEVVLTAGLLCRVHGLPARQARRVLLAAIVHDLEHDGVACGAFVYERRSVARAEPFLARAGVGEVDYRALAGMVLATDLCQGAPQAVEIHRAHGRGPTDDGIALRAPEMQALLDSQDVALAAVLLCEADVLPSVGLTLAHALRVQQRLAREWRCTLRPADKVRFIDQVVDAGVIGAYFLPNVLEIRRALDEPVHVAAC